MLIDTGFRVGRGFTARYRSPKRLAKEITIRRQGPPAPLGLGGLTGLLKNAERAILLCDNHLSSPLIKKFSIIATSVMEKK
jgi:hypothetical protein